MPPPSALTKGSHLLAKEKPLSQGGQPRTAPHPFADGRVVGIGRHKGHCDYPDLIRIPLKRHETCTCTINNTALGALLIGLFLAAPVQDGGDVPMLEVFGTFALAVGAAVSPSSLSTFLACSLCPCPVPARDTVYTLCMAPEQMKMYRNELNSWSSMNTAWISANAIPRPRAEQRCLVSVT